MQRLGHHYLVLDFAPHMIILLPAVLTHPVLLRRGRYLALLLTDAFLEWALSPTRPLALVLETFPA